jgi:RNA polymerase sigma-70 factor (ECF subfamily)
LRVQKDARRCNGIETSKRIVSRASDEELLARIARGDQDAVRAMVARKLPRLLALAGRMLGDRGDAEDVAQETFVRIWRAAPRWRSGEAKFDTWLHRVALNLCTDRLRRRRETTMAEPPEQIDRGPAPDRNLHDEDSQRLVGAALATLPDRQREAIVLHYYQELSNIDAAEAMGISVEALESLLSRARRALRPEFAKHKDELR